MTYQFPFFGKMHVAKLHKETYPDGALCLSVDIYNHAYDSFDNLIDLTKPVPSSKPNHIFIDTIRDKEFREFVQKELVSTNKIKPAGVVSVGNILLNEYIVSEDFLQELE